VTITGGDGDAGPPAFSTNDTTGSDGGSGARIDSGPSTPPNKDAAPPDPEQTCHSQSAAACKTCCDTEHSAGAKVLANALKACVCDPNVCAYDCEYSLCATPSTTPDFYCQECVQTYGTSCSTQAQTACNNDTDCAAMLKCEAGCGGGQQDAGSGADSSVDYTHTPQCDAFCAKVASACPGETCDRAIDCAQKTGACANFTPQYLQCEVDTGQFYCGSGGYSIVSQCDSVCH
jgi:hypothetical protein